MPSSSPQWSSRTLVTAPPAPLSRISVGGCNAPGTLSLDAYVIPSGDLSLSSSQRRGYRRKQEARTRRWISKKGKFSSGLVGRKFITLVTNEANYLSCSIGWGIISGITYDGKVSFEGIEFDLSGSRRNSRYRSFAVRGIKVWIFGGIFKWKFLSEA